MKKLSRQQWLLLLVLVLLLANVVVLSLFWSNEKGSNDHRGPDREKKMSTFIINELKFTPQQEKTYWTLRSEHIKRIRPVIDSMRSVRKSMLELLHQQAVPDSLLQHKTDTIAALQKQMDILIFRHFQNIKALCTPDQQEKFDTVVAELFKRMTGFHRSAPKTGPPHKDTTGKP